MARKKPWTPEQFRHFAKTGEQPHDPQASRVTADRIEFVVPGIPRPKARARITRHGNYTPKRTKQYQEAVALAYRVSTRPGGWRWECPVSLGVTAYGAHHAADIDNIVKAVSDALNGLAYKDDKQVTRIYAEKRPVDDEGPRTVVVVMRLEQGGRDDG